MTILQQDCADSTAAQVVFTPAERRAAARLDERIRACMSLVENNLATFYALLNEAKTHEIHKVLGFPSWTAYTASVFTFKDTRLTREQRREIVGYLSREGMPQRAIADIVGSSVGTVNNDLNVLFKSEQLSDDDTENAFVTSVTGKKYPQRRPRRPRFPCNRTSPSSATVDDQLRFEIDEIAGHAVTLVGNIIQLQDELKSLAAKRYTNGHSYSRTQAGCIRDHIAQAQKLLDELSNAAEGLGHLD